METYEKKIKNNKRVHKTITIRVTNLELIAFLEYLKKREVGISELTRELWKDSPDFKAFQDRNRPDIPKRIYATVENADE